MKPVSTKELKLYKNESIEEIDTSPSMPLSEHLTELRNKIIIALITLCIAVAGCFSLSRQIITIFTNICPTSIMFLQIKPGEFFFTSLRVAIYLGLAISSPIIMWQLSSFAFPGLKPKEKKVALPILVSAPVLFIIGSLFAYFFVVPSMLNFLFGFGKDVISSSISIESYVSFTLMIMAICGIAFLLPIVLLALANVEIVNSKMLLNKSKHAILTSAILGAILTPTPDPFNMLIISSILITLYFVSWGILRIVQK